jgi:hypothetical protein
VGGDQGRQLAERAAQVVDYVNDGVVDNLNVRRASCGIT